MSDAVPDWLKVTYKPGPDCGCRYCWQMGYMGPDPTMVTAKNPAPRPPAPLPKQATPRAAGLFDAVPEDAPDE